MRQRVLLPLLSLLTTTYVFAAVTGSVFTVDGKPLAKATIRAFRVEESAARRERLAGGSERKALATTTANEDGTFSLDATGVVELHVAHDGYAPQLQYAFADDFPAVFSLPTAPPRTMKVTANGKAVAKARVYGLMEWDVSEVDLGSTNDAGELTIPAPSGWVQSLLILHPDFAPREIPTRSMRALSVELTRGTAISGRVVGADGKPVASAMLLSGNWPVGRTRADGTFTVAGATPEITAIANGAHGSGSGPEIRLEPRQTISGTVVDADGRPIAGLLVSATPKTSEPGNEEPRYSLAVTDEKGRFQLDGLDAVQQQVYAMPVGDLEFHFSTVDLRRTRHGSVALKATRAERLRGVVLDERRKPVGGAIVSFLHPQAPLAYLSYGAELAATRTAADGSFRMHSPHGEIRLAAIHARYAAAVSEPLDADKSKRKPLVITLRDGIEVRGRVLDADEKPVADAAIAVLQDPAGTTPMPLDGMLSSGNARPLFESAADGTFRLRLNDKPHDVTVVKEGYAPARIGGFTPGGDPLRVVLTRGASIEGRVVRKDGGAVGEGEIFLGGEDGTHTMIPIAADGSFAATSLVPGEYSLTVVTEHGARLEKIVKAPAANLLLELERTVTVTGTVVDKASGTPLSKYRVYSGSGTTAVENGGPFQLQLSPGEAEIMVEADGYTRGQHELTIEPGKPASVEIAMVRARSIRGRVVGPDGSPLAEAMVMVHERYESGETTAEEGEFQLDGVPVGVVTLAISREGYLGRRVAVAADRTEVEIALTKGRGTTGRVVDENGQPVERAQITASSAAHDADTQTATSIADGTFRIDGLADGRHTFRAAKPGYREAELRDVDLAANAPVVLTLRGSGATGTLRGSVSGFAGGSWLHGSVTVSSLDDDRGWAQGVIQRDGSYRVEDAPAGPIEVRARAASARKEISSRRVTTQLPARGEVEVNLAFDDSVVIRGVVTAAGQAAAGRSVSFYSSNGSWRSYTDNDGRYELTGIEPGQYQVSVMSGSRTYTTIYEVTGSATFDIAADFARLEGRVVDRDGAAVAGAKIEASAQNNSVDTTSDSRGAFTLEVQAGAYEVRASKKGFATALTRGETGGSPLLLRLVQSDGIQVRLVDARDNTTLGGYVVARDTRGVQLGRVHEQEADGTLRLAVASGSYRVSVSADGYATQTVLASAPMTSELRIGLTPGGTLIVTTDRDATETVKLVMANGEEYVRCECNGIAAIRLTGKITQIEHIAPGAYAMQVIGAGGKVLALVPVQVTEGGTAVVEAKW
ncbi:MAG TPA: carboxypeptidase-like regulatory domain-containing protein [Thermoanaerobaculia bacterium]|jgi:hypothetical protein